MTPHQLLQHAGIKVTYSSIEVPSYRQAGVINRRARRFIRFQNELLNRPLCANGNVGAHLVAFEMLDPIALAALNSMNMSLLPTAFGPALEFGNPGTTAKRYLLSQMSMACMSQGEAWHTNPQFALIDFLKSFEDYQQFSENQVLTELRCDQLAWAYKYLPITVFSHLAGIIVCSPLSSDAWQRQRTKLVPVAQLDDIDDNACYAVSNLLDATCTTEGTNSSSALISRATSCLNVISGESDKDCLQRWLRLLDALAPRLQEYVPAVGLVISWIGHLVEHGTVKAQDADIQTRRRYAQVLAGPLYKQIHKLPADPSSWTILSRYEVYTKLILDSEQSDKRAMSAAIASFQDFLFEAFDVQPVQANLSRLVPDALPRAQQVYLHEVERVSGWFADAPLADEAFRLRLQTALWMSYSAPFRIAELLSLQMSSISPLPNGDYEVWITPTRDASVKTSAGRRRVWIRDPKACAFLQDLISHRIKDCATATDLLFARGVEGRVAYQAGRLRRFMLAALKAATGDSQMTIYALRHSWVCRELESFLLSSDVAGYNRLAHLAAQVGHVSAHTTLQFYFHRMEWPLRVHINTALADQLNWTRWKAHNYLGKAVTARQRRFSRLTGSTLSLSELMADVDVPNAVVSADANGWQVPAAPILPIGTVVKPSPTTVLHLLLQLQEGEYSEELLAHRFGISAQKVRAAVDHVRDVLSHFSTTPSKRSTTNDSSPSKQSKAPFAIKKVLQPKYLNAVKKLWEDKLDAPTIRRGVAAWKVLRNRYGYIELKEGLETFAFLAMLSHLGFAATDLSVVTCIPPNEAEIKLALNTDEAQALKKALKEYQDRKDDIREAFLRGMNALPKSFFQCEVPHHPTRPSVYLRWDAPVKANAVSVASAASDLRGLDALLLVLSTFLHIDDSEVA